MDIGNKNKEDDSQNTGIISPKKDKDQKRKNGKDHPMNFFIFVKDTVPNVFSFKSVENKLSHNNHFD